MELSVCGQGAYFYSGGTAHRPGRPAIVFLHGAASDHSVFVLQTRYFAHHGWTVVAPDLPGHGRSPGAVLESVEAMGAWVLALLDALGLEQAVLVGHSMGSLIALEAAGQQPLRARALALLGSAFPMKVSAQLLDSAALGSHDALDMINVWSHGPAAQRGSGPIPGQWIMGSGLRLLERHAGPLYQDFRACDAYSGAPQRAAAITCPVLLVCGSRDQMTPPKAGRELAGRLCSSKVAVIDGAGHDLMGEQPDALLDELRRFLVGLDQGR